MSYLNTSSFQTLDKCQRILRMFQQIGNQSSMLKKDHHQGSSSKKIPNPYYLTQSAAKKSASKTTLTKQPSISKSLLKSSTSFLNQSQYQSTKQKDKRQPLLTREKSNTSFVSCYNKESRLDKIMKLKVPKPNVKTAANLKSHKQTMILNTSLSSLNSSRSSLNKQNLRPRNKQSRLQKIMNIKVQKPKVNSTLIGYEPRKCERSQSKSLNKKTIDTVNSVFEIKQCKKRLRKSEQIQQKEDRLWKLFERQRQQQLKDKKRQQEKSYKQQRRQQQKFQKLVQKQLHKIENSRQISLRKDRAFSQYVYPAY